MGLMASLSIKLETLILPEHCRVILVTFVVDESKNINFYFFTPVKI